MEPIMKTRILVSFAALAFSATAVAEDIPTSQPSGPDLSLDATFGSIALDTGFMPDPHAIELAAGGPLHAAGLGDGCVGYIAEAPDVELTYTAGDTFPLNIYVVSDADTTLVVNLPDGSWACNDDSSGFNPLLSMESPSSGVYDIYVGHYSGAETPPAVLNISEIAPVWPE
jgi:hypothetical protein